MPDVFEDICTSSAKQCLVQIVRKSNNVLECCIHDELDDNIFISKHKDLCVSYVKSLENIAQDPTIHGEVYSVVQFDLSLGFDDAQTLTFLPFDGNLLLLCIQFCLHLALVWNNLAFTSYKLAK